MSRRPRKPQFPVSLPDEPGEAALVWVDAAPLLKAGQTKLRAEKKKLSVAEERVRQHRLSDEPDYQQWFNTTFAQRLGEIRELYAKLAELDAIVSKVEREILATGCSALEAYESVMQMMSDEAAEEKEKTESQTNNESERPDDETEHSSESRSESIDEDAWSATSKASASTGDKAVDEMIKQVYRSLVRKLHPDLNPDLPEALRERWFEVQQAYSDRDLSRLEMLLAASEDGENAPDDSFIDKIQSLSRLRLLLKSVAKKLKASRRQLAQFKATPAWEFHRVRKDSRRMAILERNVKFELRNAEEALGSDVRTLEAQIERWKNPPPERKRNRRDWNLSFEY